ncbi:MAG: hypothetical protein WC179_08050 [Candidatus Cloacimonadaceae bacterium]
MNQDSKEPSFFEKLLAAKASYDSSQQNRRAMDGIYLGMKQLDMQKAKTLLDIAKEESVANASRLNTMTNAQAMLRDYEDRLNRLNESGIDLEIFAESLPNYVQELREEYPNFDQMSEEKQTSIIKSHYSDKFKSISGNIARDKNSILKSINQIKALIGEVKEENEKQISTLSAIKGLFSGGK